MVNNQSVVFETIAKDEFIYGREQKGDFVVRDASTLAKLYSEMYPLYHIPEEKPNPPQIDFNKQMVIAVFQGAGYSGGYDIIIKSLTKDDKGLEVLVKETEPKRDAVLTRALTCPAHIIKTDRYDGEVNFKR